MYQKKKRIFFRIKKNSSALLLVSMDLTLTVGLA